MPSPRPIIGAFQDIGEQVVEQVKQIPKDVGQTALESVGLGSGGKKQGNKLTPGATQDPGSNWKKLDEEKNEKAKKEIARMALEELLKPSQTPKEPSIWEKIQKEEQEKKEATKQQQQAQANSLPMPKGKSKQGALGLVNKSKQQGHEGKINMKQD